MEKLKIGDTVKFNPEFGYGDLLFIVGDTDGSRVTVYPIFKKNLIEIGVLRDVPTKFISFYTPPTEMPSIVG